MIAYSRRVFLRLLFAVGLSADLSAAAATTGIDGNTQDRLTRRLSRLFTDKDSARAVGARYLARFPQEANVRLLTALICGSTERMWQLADLDTPILRQALARQNIEDFSSGRTVVVDGWTLSETEARLCAIVAII
jgi:hypothetical protein